jgi:hypothetical protein
LFSILTYQKCLEVLESLVLNCVIMERTNEID